ncbi:MAG: reverse transcriptase domain-containing protein, partial [Sweet potato little leaf phytoplasma]|nr:reverse transcriptase domain-containing protein [Sweet potato little leaf phytoplasma]
QRIVDISPYVQTNLIIIKDNNHVVVENFTRNDDTVDWKCVQEVFVGLKFPPKFIKWIMVCISTPSYMLSINGELAGYFKGKLGLTQGDPISPMLFVLIMHMLTRQIKKGIDDEIFKFHPLCRQFKITDLCR